MGYDSIFMKQKIMRKVMISLVPITAFAVWRFGSRVLILLCVVCAAGIAAEYASMKYFYGKNQKISEAVIVTCILYTLSLPPMVPYWVAAIGILFGLFFGKEVFGGFGKNIFNPAILGRCFIYISFPAYMTVSWMKPYTTFPGGLAAYSAGIDAFTSATPMILMKRNMEVPSYMDMFLGNVSGSMGEMAKILILVSAAYLVLSKTASWKLMLSCFSSFAVCSSVLYIAGIINADPLFAVLSGGFLFAVVFMVTDPVTSPSDEKSKIIYGCIIGILTVIIRNFSLFPEGMMFAILIGNMMSPLIDKKAKEYFKTKKVIST